MHYVVKKQNWKFFWQIVPALYYKKNQKKKVKWNITSFWHTTYKYMCLSPWYFWPSRFKVNTIWRGSNCLCSMFGFGRRIRVRVSSVGTQRNTIPNHVKLDWILFFRHEFDKKYFNPVVCIVVFYFYVDSLLRISKMFIRKVNIIL